ncbi:MAG: 4Fe-4S dicluster domain-containing protein [Desulfatiglandales bacterium]|nr:4Fe-4S dicluster domain-containing protein [Desulfatiglandales bacterium]
MTMAKELYMDPGKCTGCRTCELVCSIKNEGMANPVLSRIQIIADKSMGLRIPTVCLQCENPVCVSVCPVGALQRKEGPGIVQHDKNKCIGCRSCVMACPFGGVAINHLSGQIFKCELCDGDPECVKACEDKAITYEESDAALMNKKRVAAQNLCSMFERYASRPHDLPG